MSHNKLKLNDVKTEALIIYTPWILNTTFVYLTIVLWEMFSVSYNLRITFDMHLTITVRVVNMSRTAKFESVESAQYAIIYLSVQATQIGISAFTSFTVGLF